MSSSSIQIPDGQALSPVEHSDPWRFRKLNEGHLESEGEDDQQIEANLLDVICDPGPASAPSASEDLEPTAPP